MSFLSTVDKMPKVYFCDKIFEGKVCGETNQDKFEKGRYSLCKECKKKQVYQIRKSKKEEDKDKKIKEVDLEGNLREIAADTIMKIPLKNGDTIQENFKDLSREISSVRESHNDQINITNRNFDAFTIRYDNLYKKYESIEKKYRELVEYYGQLAAYINKPQENFFEQRKALNQI